MKQSAAGWVTADKLKNYDLLNEARIDKDKRTGTGTGTGDQLWALLPTQ